MNADTTGSPTGAVLVLIRLEGACVLAAATIAYATYGAGWGTYAIFFLAPDLSFLGYLVGRRTGAVAYNAAHSYVGALAVLFAGLLMPMPAALSAGLIWCAHIGFDRMMGYGLKYSAGFQFTSLGRIGREKKASQ